MNLVVYCDGSARNNGYNNAVGAWAYVILKDDNIIHEEAESVIGATNQQMELTAAIKALDYIYKTLSFNPFDNIVIYTDSSYLCNCCNMKWYKNWINNGWKNSQKANVANKELWEKLIPYFDTPEITFKKVKGHSNGQNEHEKWNNYVDKKAQSESLARVIKY